MSKTKKGAKSPPKTRVARSAVIGTVAARATGKKLMGEFKAAFQPVGARAESRAQTREEIAAIVFEGLSRLRGSALKLAQVFCVDTGLLPQEYLATFEQAHYRVPALSPALVRSVLRRELKQDPEKIFSEFQWEAAGAASLGQVHRGRLHDGSDVAVKIQYPGMKETLVSDVSLARIALKPLLRTGLLLSTLNQLEKRLHEEVDYGLELAQLQWFGGQGLGDKVPPIAVPKAYAEFSTSRVLCMQWMDGETLDQWAKKSPSQSERDRVAQSLFELFVESVFVRQRFHSDANLGNFLIQPSGQVALLDFGAVTSLPEDEVQFYRRLWRSKGQAEALTKDYQTRGAVTDKGFWDQCVQPYLSWIDQLWAKSTFDFAANSDFVNEGYRLFTAQMFNPNLQSYQDQLPLVHRTLLGLFSLFTRLKATIATASIAGRLDQQK